MLRISRGVGRSDFWPLLPLSEAVSSRMMSLHSSMHSSQMNTEGPAMSLRTSCWLLPQKEQYSSFSPDDDFSDMSLAALPWLLAGFPADESLVHDAEMQVGVAIVGAGACGLTAALMLHDAGVECVVLERDAMPSG